MEASEVLLILLALVLGAVAGYVLGRRTASPSPQSDGDRLALTDARQDAATARAEASRAREEAALTKAEVAQILAEKSELRTAAAEAQRVTAEAQAETARVRAQVAAAMAERDAAIERATEQAADRESLVAQFRLLSAQTLEKQQQAAEQATEQRFKATEHLVSPLADGLRQMQEKLHQVETERARMSAELGEQVSTLRLSGEAIRRETLSLSNALRTPQVRGSWGESSLKRIVEISGLVERCDFDTQTTYTTDEGRFRPDLRVNLPAGKVIFVDSKVPLAAVLEAYNTEDEAAQRTHLQTFARHVRTHIDQLADKNYWQLDLGSPSSSCCTCPATRSTGSPWNRLPTYTTTPPAATSCSPPPGCSSRNCRSSRTAGNRWRSRRPPRRSPSWAASCTSASSRWATTSTSSAGRWAAQSATTTRPSAPSRPASWSPPAASATWASLPTTCRGCRR
ncbi:DNA recombination protein RmuC [Tessaracoccus defluvii]|uniref:DNA recombination protein RmuC n=1 Tax=Tessaracoccus defluvii TaxID=1285901 RepID=A0A7H0H264_9ACTN|nr:DNA recombination protein RmuC [Tessaracoccus defluvii]QNP54630.1 DNA recombination protein RmuC [Tessaracoccus defluvii]